MREVWKDLQQYEGLYQISSFGQIKSCRRRITRVKADGTEVKVTLSEKLLKPRFCEKRQQLMVTLVKDNHRHDHLLAELVAIHYLDAFDASKHHEVAFADGDPKHCRLGNLIIKRPKEKPFRVTQNGIRYSGMFRPISFR